jgi:hypothetical protein
LPAHSAVESGDAAMVSSIHWASITGALRLSSTAWTISNRGTDWHLWAVGTHYELTADRQWLRRVAPRLVLPCRWTVGQTEMTKRLSPASEKLPEYGLVPPGVTADWGLFASVIRSR